MSRKTKNNSRPEGVYTNSSDMNELSKIVGDELTKLIKCNIEE